MLDRDLFSTIFYVKDYGMIPQTLWEDGDALDVFVLVTNPTYPGILIKLGLSACWRWKMEEK